MTPERGEWEALIALEGEQLARSGYITNGAVACRDNDNNNDRYDCGPSMVLFGGKQDLNLRYGSPVGL